jgi:alginate O-acetyltransferase complex protein AlgI
VRVGITFVIVCLSWVFFRAKTLGQAMLYFRSLFGLVATSAASDTVAGAIYTPYHGALFVIAALVVWTMPNTWAFTARLPGARAAYAMVMLGLAVVLMWTQTTNPFLYFQF